MSLAVAGSVADTETLSAIVDRCKEEGGLMVTTLQTLRESLGYHRLGKWVLTSIGQNLLDSGVGFFPMDVLDPAQNTVPRKEQEIWLYLLDGSLMSRVIAQVSAPFDHEAVKTTLLLVNDEKEDLDTVVHRIKQLPVETKLKMIQEIVQT